MDDGFRRRDRGVRLTVRDQEFDANIRRDQKELAVKLPEGPHIGGVTRTTVSAPASDQDRVFLEMQRRRVAGAPSPTV
jgi:hypothetical protein